MELTIDEPYDSPKQKNHHCRNFLGIKFDVGDVGYEWYQDNESVYYLVDHKKSFVSER